MSDSLPAIALRVADLPRSLAFYCDGLGFTRAAVSTTDDLATIIDVDGDAFLLAGPEAADLTPYLSPNSMILPASEMLRYANTDLAALRDRLAGHGGARIQDVRLPWGDPGLDVSDPDGRVLRFVGQVQRTPDEQLALFAGGLGDLDAALQGLADADLDLAPSEGGWTIRQIVNHLVDGETLIVLPHVKMALAEPGRTRISTSWNQDTWARALYNSLDISTSVALLRATRAYVLALLRGQPQAWDQFALVRSSAEAGGEGRKVTVGEMVVSMAHHVYEHVEQIRQLRAAHGR